MVKIRLQRIGKSKMPSYRLIAVPSTAAAKKNAALEILGNYDPRSKKGSFESERINYWLKNGAKLSATANNLLIGAGILSGKKTAIKIKKPAAPAPPKPEAPAA